jgi:hypothetical protein
MITVVGFLEMCLAVGAANQGEEPLKGQPLLSAATASLVEANYHYDKLRVDVYSVLFFLRSLNFYAYEACSVSSYPLMEISVLFLFNLRFFCQLVSNTWF